MNQQELGALAKNELILSDSLGDHFDTIVSSLEAIGAQRRGSKQIKDASGRNLIVDIYMCCLMARN